MNHIGQKVDGVIKYVDQKAHDKQIASIKDGDWVTTTHKRPRKPKTLPQMGYYYAVILPIITKAMNDLGWEYAVTIQGTEMSFEMTEVEADLWLKNAYAKGKNKADMSCENATDFIDKCLLYAPKNFKVNIPPPEKRK